MAYRGLGSVLESFDNDEVNIASDVAVNDKSFSPLLIKFTSTNNLHIEPQA